ncbi:porin [Candidatus Methylopumilus turicensis]|uniref:porin n=1 Tax=Candidatus Methylopumilus turicensis TaxID=1581680 RepID=UPI001E57A24D|nr:porin [Candidatus Methylopumilus turicensis]
MLPTALAIGAKTRQNDLDVAVQFSFWTGINASSADNLNGSGASNGGLGYSSLNIRQSFLSFGDASWGTVKAGRDLGVFGSDAILSDMTLLGVGSNAGSTGSSTLGRIGSGYLYADWLAQLQYQTPNFNGFQATVAVQEALGQVDNSNLGYAGKVTYDFAANDVTGRVWVGGVTTKRQNGAAARGADGLAVSASEVTADAYEVGAKVAYQGAELVGYYYDGQNMDGGVGQFPGSTFAGAAIAETKNSGGYVQGTFKLPTIGTKLGASWGVNNIGAASREAWIVGAYHPLTKSVNLVAEYNNLETDTGVAGANATGKARTVSLGAILFF